MNERRGCGGVRSQLMPLWVSYKCFFLSSEFLLMDQLWMRALGAHAFLLLRDRSVWDLIDAQRRGITVVRNHKSIRLDSPCSADEKSYSVWRLQS